MKEKITKMLNLDVRKMVKNISQKEEYNKLMNYITNHDDLFPSARGIFSNSYFTLYSKCGYISLCDDVYGYEIKLKGTNYSLDCSSSKYGLTDKNAQDLFDAIASAFNKSKNKKELLELKMESKAKLFKYLYLNDILKFLKKLK